MAARQHSTPTPLRPVSSLDLEAEFLLLHDLRERATRRMNELVDALRVEHGYGAPCFAEETRTPFSLQAATLPAAGLTQAAPGVLLFKRGRDA